MELRESYGRIEGRIQGPEEDRNSTESTNLDPWELSETEPPSKEHTRAGTEALATHIAVVQLISMTASSGLRGRACA